MTILVLGAGAGGGFPQWNCNCRNCRGVRSGTVRARPRTQSSIAVSSDSANWALINASPDLLTQLKSLPQLQPARAMRDTGIRAVILVDSQIDHTLGLAMLREGARLEVYCTASVREDLTTGNPLLRMLESYCGVTWHEIRPVGGAPFGVPGVEGVEFTAVAVKSKAPPYSPHRETPQPGDNIALMMVNAVSGRSVFYAPGLAEIEPEVWRCMSRADCVMVDGTFWTDDEMIRLGAGRKRALEMGHLAQSGEDGMLSWLKKLPHARKVLIHINNTNPILDEDSAQRRELERAGIEVAFDGMEISL
ncbi:MAG TPA: pyrroloquinoline quinone biosynthesis protein PqqB [Candidatus Binataceae bacterium]|jgi:pyrroloquinoline quinone biosynthesis protein B|nr:pyrroloquinoline quinone biosynthesis protein PqqB [Candidatus Binataceae bacterium]